MSALYPVFLALIFNALDFVSGFICAVKDKNIQSAKMRDGLFKKVGFLFCYAIAYIIDTYGSVIGFQINVPVLPCIVLYVCVTEIVSIIENICKINPDLVPDKLMDLFHITKE